MDTGIYFDSCWKSRLLLLRVKEVIRNTDIIQWTFWKEELAAQANSIL